MFIYIYRHTTCWKNSYILTTTSFMYHNYQVNDVTLLKILTYKVKQSVKILPLIRYMQNLSGMSILYFESKFC